MGIRGQLSLERMDWIGLMDSYLGIQEISSVESPGFQASTADFLECTSLRSLIKKVIRHSF